MLKVYIYDRLIYKATIVKICDRIANLKHSHKTQSRMLKMYVDENINFFNSIYNLNININAVTNVTF